MRFYRFCTCAGFFTAIAIAIVSLVPMQTAAQPFRIIGYLPTYKFEVAELVDYTRLTHVNIAFANPTPDGTLSCDGIDIIPIVNLLHKQECEVFISLGGGVLLPAWEAAWDTLASAPNRSTFISKIVEYVNDHALDGVDVDLEWQYVKEWYSPFVVELSQALKPHGKTLTAALPGEYRYPLISNEALAVFDWVNLMVYDKTGPWDAQHPGPHAPLDWTPTCIDYWKSQGLSKERLTVGLPFYGYDFSTTPVSAVSYSALVRQNSANAHRDGDGAAHWNGIPTIRTKTQLAKREASGVMIWEVTQDVSESDEDLSLLLAINQEVRGGTSNTGWWVDDGLMAYPNPAHDYFALRPSAMNTHAVTRIELFSSVGEKVRDITLQESHQRVDIADLSTGTYYAVMHTIGGITRTMISKVGSR